MKNTVSIIQNTVFYKEYCFKNIEYFVRRMNIEYLVKIKIIYHCVRNIEKSVRNVEHCFILNAVFYIEYWR